LLPVSIIVPIFNAEAHLEKCLSSLRNQDYPKHLMEILVIDGGSTDRSKEIAESYGARVLQNPKRDAQIGKAIGIRNISPDSEFVALIDADNEVAAPNWLSTLVGALVKEPEALGAESDYLPRPEDPAINRLSIRMRLEDPFVRCFANLHRNANQLSRKGYAIWEIFPNRFPVFGANGFVWRKNILLRALPDSFSSFDEADVSANIVSLGHNKIVFIKGTGIFHHHIATLPHFVKKRVRTGKEFIERAGRKKNDGQKLWTNRYGKAELAFHALYCISFIGPFIESLREYRKDGDRAWFLLPLLSFLGVAIYAGISLFYRPTDCRPQAERESLALAGQNA
jgi:glycosyltransferase involved in cell wall biosynthesis